VSQVRHTESELQRMEVEEEWSGLSYWKDSPRQQAGVGTEGEGQGARWAERHSGMTTILCGGFGDGRCDICPVLQGHVWSAASRTGVQVTVTRMLEDGMGGAFRRSQGLARHIAWLAAHHELNEKRATRSIDASRAVGCRGGFLGTKPIDNTEDKLVDIDWPLPLDKYVTFSDVYLGGYLCLHSMRASMYFNFQVHTHRP